MSDQIEGPSEPQSEKTAESLFQDLAAGAIEQMRPPVEPEVDPELDGDTESDPLDVDDTEEAAGIEDGGGEDSSEAPPGFEEEEVQSKGQETVSKKVFDKRIGKATKRIRGLERELEELRAQASSRPAPLPDGTNPVAVATTSAQLEEFAQQADVLADQVNRLRIEVKRDPEAVTRTLEAQGITTDDPELWLEEQSLHLNTITSRTIPARRGFVEEREKQLREANTKYPWLTSSTDPKAQWVKDFKKKYPQAEVVVPELDLILARAMVGWHAEAKSTVAKQPTTQASRPRSAKAARKTDSNLLSEGARLAREQGNARPFFEAQAADLINRSGLLKR